MTVPVNGLGSVSSGLRLRVLLPLTVAMALLVVTFVWTFIAETRHREAEDIARTSESVNLMVRERSSESVRSVQSIIELVMKDRHLEAAFRAGDRKALLELSEPILDQVRMRNLITHFYYIQPDRTMLLRVHAPTRHGDKVERFVLQEAVRTGRPAWGNEQGPLGSFTLRVVYPWVSKGVLIGYLEMGIEFEDIMQSIRNFLDVNVFVAINKPFFNRAKWDEAQSQKSHPVAWDEFPEVVLLSRTTRQIPAPIGRYLRALKERHSMRTFEIEWEGRVAQTIVVPFENLRGQQLGELLVVRDITDGAIERRQAVLGVAVVSAVIGGALMLFFYVFLGRVQRDVAARMARLRVVEELAAAKEAAEAALRDNEKITQELRATQSELLATARKAGMAEIATNVLHNVGNVLNSVNVSADLVRAQLRDSKLTGLGLATQMIVAHADKLGDFFTRDAKGKLLPDYLNKLTAALKAEQQTMIDELTLLTRSIDHIKAIVATQQAYAGNSSVLEPVRIDELVEDALRMNDGALARHQVTVVREFAEVPVARLDKARVIQILVNLISNAKHAMSALEGPRVITIQVEMPAPGRLRVRVRDQGEGIPAQNLVRIFTHGFTTRPDGHGFGLHSCALAASALGGTLGAHSDGPGKGALFTLDLPFEMIR